jgi:hypothetical protein
MTAVLFLVWAQPGVPVKVPIDSCGHRSTNGKALIGQQGAFPSLRRFFDLPISISVTEK